MHDSCGLFYDDGTFYIYNVSIFSDTNTPSNYVDNFSATSIFLSNVSFLDPKVLIDTADSDCKEKMSKDEENAIFITDAQPKRVSTFKKMARLTANATGTSIRALLEPIANTEHNAVSFLRKRALDDSSYHDANKLEKRFKATGIDTSSGPAISAVDQPP